MGAKEATSAATPCSLSVLWKNNLLALLGLSTLHLAGDIRCDFHWHIQMAIQHTIQLKKHRIRRLLERTLVARIARWLVISTKTQRSWKKYASSMRKRGTFIARWQQFAHSHACQGQAGEISSRSHKYKQYGCFHFLFLLFLLYTSFSQQDYRVKEQDLLSRWNSSLCRGSHKSSHKLPDSFWKDLGWSHASPSLDEQSSAVEVPTLLQSTEMTQRHTVPFFKDLQANKARNSFFIVLFGDFSHPKFLSQTKISGLASFGFSYPSSAVFSHLNTRYQVLMILHWFCLRKMSLKVTCMYSSIHDTEISY